MAARDGGENVFRIEAGNVLLDHPGVIDTEPWRSWPAACCSGRPITRGQ